MGRIMRRIGTGSATQRVELGGNIKESKQYGGFTLSGIIFEYAVVNQVVFLKMTDGSTSSAKNTGDSLGTVPNICKPYIQTDNRDVFSNVRFIIKVDGSVEVRENVSQGTVMRGSFTYLQA